MSRSRVIRQPSETEYLNCIRCGLCLAVCPTYQENLSETASPRGRVALARKNLEGELEPTRNLYDQMYACFDCLACDEICPVGIHPAQLVMEMRSLQEQRRQTSWKKMLLGKIVPIPQRLEIATLPLRIYERSGLRRLVYAVGLPKLIPDQLRDMEAMLPHLPQRPLRRLLPDFTPARGESRYRVGFFLGCVQSMMFADESADTVQVLSRNACTVITPREAVCCGMPALGFGRADLVREQARSNIARFESANVDVIVTDCATCGSTLKNYDRILSDDPTWAERAAGFSSKVRDIHEFLMTIPLKKPQNRIEGRVTYHDPCHLRRAQGIWIQPRELLKMIPGLEFVELPEADWCCGSAGSQIITHYETSIGVLKRKSEKIAETKTDFIASGCPGCQMQLTIGVKRAGLKTDVLHPMTLLNRAYRDTE